MRASRSVSAGGFEARTGLFDDESGMCRVWRFARLSGKTLHGSTNYSHVHYARARRADQDAAGGLPKRLARLEREATTLASLNHPSIAQIHGLEKGLRLKR